MKKIIFAVLIIGIGFYLFPNIIYAIDDDCELKILPSVDSEETNVEKIKYKLNNIYTLRLFVPDNCNINNTDLSKIVLHYESKSQSPVNFNSDSTEADFFGFGIIWGSGRTNPIACSLHNGTDSVMNAHGAGIVLNNNNILTRDPKLYSTNVQTGKIVYEIHTSAIDDSGMFPVTIKDGDRYFEFNLRLCTPGNGEIYALYGSNLGSNHPTLLGSEKRLSDKYKVNRGIIQRNIDEVPGGPIVAQVLVSIFSGFMCWLVSKPITRTESAEVRGAVIQPIFGCAGMIFGALLLPVFGHGDWFLAAFLIFLSLAFASLVGVLTTRSP